MSASETKLGRALHRRRLNADSVRFADASIHFGRELAAGRASGVASPQMRKALSRWQRDVRHARARVAALPHGVSGRRRALHALGELVGALEELKRGFSLDRPGSSRAAFGQARHKLDAYHRLAAKLERDFG